MTPDQFKTLMPHDHITFGDENFCGEIAEQIAGVPLTFRVILDGGNGEAFVSIDDCETTVFEGARAHAIAGGPLP
jgi:hypothetical protein